MVSFLYSESKEILTTLLGLVVKPETVANCKSGAQLKEIDLLNKPIY